MSEATPVEIRQARYRAMADPGRRRLLRHLDDSQEPCDISNLADALGLHPNTVRGHLDVLEKANLVIRSPETRETPGRPRMLYAGVARPDSSDSGSYRLLADVLTTSLRVGSQAPKQAAEEAGRTWGLYLTERPSPSRPPGFEESAEQITTILGDMGFEPAATHEDGATRIDLGDCPFRELAKEHPDVVCSIHLGLLRGAAEALGGAAVIDSLEPFVEPSVCRTLIRPS